MARKVTAAKAARKTAARKAAATSNKPTAKKAAAKKATVRKAATKRVARPAVKSELRLPVFVSEYLVDFNGARAARAAGVPERSARVQASQWLAREDVQALIREQVEGRRERLVVEADEVARRYYELATADPRELIELRRRCCRYCHGRGHHYQYTPAELARAQAQFAREHPDAGDLEAPGGTGYDPRKDPHPDCPECFGEGVEQPFVRDTRHLSPQAAMLYAGVKVTKDGLQVLMHDQISALTHFARSIGMFKQKVELTGKDGGPVEHSLKDVLAELDGADTGVGPAASRS